MITMEVKTMVIDGADTNEIYQIQEVADAHDEDNVTGEDAEENDDACGVEGEWNCNHEPRWIGHLLRHSPLPRLATLGSCSSNRNEQL